MAETIKMVALDLDGTTLNSRKEISPHTIEVFRQAMIQGVHIVVATGRVWSSLPAQVLGIDGLEYIITSNGARITRTRDEELIFEQTLDPDAVTQIVELVRGRDFSVDAFTEGGAYIDAKEYDDILRNGSDYRNAEYVLSTRKPVEGLLDFVLDHRANMENISLNFPTKESMEWTRSRLKEIDNITLTSSWVNNLEIGGPSTSKANALRFLMDKLGIRKSELMACGDSPNDLRMMELARIGIAVDNASDDMKKRADHVTSSNDEDGVARAIERFVLK